MSPARFLTLTDVSETLNVSLSQVKALVRSGELAGVKLGGRGVWRVEASELESYIQRMYEQTRATIAQGTGTDPLD
ncbi:MULTISPECIES: helix-turn-helix domain-containing protein [unclassified Serinicoccus]|uniref:helix-turn-helix domain-containing protein n=1 Tax=unclassified Serinicoccus TaxID=2643101 RepID=UPI003854B847